ncbi:MAG: site-2 protease family protein [bacterium]|nr:site-2 protease family protein [bacterium]
MGIETWQVRLVDIAVQYLIIVLVITVHEWAHAWVANRCGDATARYLGRMTLNPLPHLDLVGTVLLPLLMISGFFGGIGVLGWGKPVPVNPVNFRHYRRDDIAVSMAGPVSNIVMSVVALVLVRVASWFPSAFEGVARGLFLEPLAGISFMLAFFNLLPVPPLDGSHVVRQVLGWEARQVYDRIGQYGFVLLLVFVNTPLSDWYFGVVTRFYGVVARLVGGVTG